MKMKKNELIPTRTVTGWRMCIDYRRLNQATRKDHFPLPFMDQMLETLTGQAYYCFLDGYSGYIQILVNLEDQEKTAFTCPFGVFAYKLCRLDCVMRLQPFKDACSPFFRIWLRNVSKFSWMTFLYLGKVLRNV